MNKYFQIILLAFIVFAGYKLLQKFGLIKTAEENKEAKDIAEAVGAKRKEGKETSAMNPLYVTQLIKTSPIGSKIKLLPQAKASDFAKEVYKAKGYFKDDDGAVLKVFKDMETKSQVSQVSQMFKNAYKTDMLTYLSFMDKPNLSAVIELVNSMPSGKI